MSTKYLKQPVETFLNETDYDFMGYMPTTEALLFVNFIKEVNNGQEENQTPPVHLKMMDTVFNGEKRCAILCHRGIGKSLSLDSKVYKENGPTTINDIQPGDSIYGRDGILHKVTNKSIIFNKPMYRLTFIDGRTVKASEDHIWTVFRHHNKRIGKGHKGNINGMKQLDMTTSELLDDYKGIAEVKGNRTKPEYFKYSVPLTSPIRYPEKLLEVDPYTLGCLIGDGALKGQTRFSSHLDDTSFYLKQFPYSAGVIKRDSRNNSVDTWTVKGISKLINQLGLNVTSHFKFIPTHYLYSSVDQRLALLQGLMDTDGSVTTSAYQQSFCTVSEELSKNVLELIYSLGGQANVRTKQVSYRGSKPSTAYIIMFTLSLNPFRLPRKASKFRAQPRQYMSITDISRIADEPSQCISIDSPDKLFLTDNYIPTHNTTLFAEYLILFCAAFGYVPGFGKTNLILYVTDSIENGVKNLRRNVEFRYANSEFLQKLIPNRRITIGTDGDGHVDTDDYELQVAGGRKFTDIRLEFVNHKGHRTVVKGYGATTGVRGAKEMGQRPTLAILDDLVSDTDANSPTIIATIENTVYKAVSKALSPMKQKMIWLGTPFNAKDPLYKAVESGAWQVSVFPICEEFPVSKEEFKGSWEDRFTYEYVKDEYEEAQALGMPANFNQELMLRIMSEEDRLVKEDDIRWYNDSSVIEENKGNYNFYITTDFATSEKQSADFSVISVWAYTNNGVWLWVDGIIKRQLMDQNMKDLFNFVSIYKPQSVGVEVSGQQGGFISWIENLMLEKNVFFNLLEVRPNGNKMARFHVILPQFKLKKIRFPNDRRNSTELREIMEELTNASKSGFKSKHDDFIDTVSMLAVIDPWKPSETVVVENLDAGTWKTDVIPENLDTSYDII